MILTLLFGLILGAISVVFILQNTEVVTIAFMGWQTEGSLALIILASILMGALLTSVFSIPEVIRTHMKISSLKKENKNLTENLEATQPKVVENKTVYTEQDLPPRA